MSLAIAAATVVAPLRSAQACSAPMCWATESFALPERGTIPSNAPGLAVYVGRDGGNDAGARQITLSEVAASGPVAVPFTTSGERPTLLVPSAALREGAHYRLEVTNPCGSTEKPPMVSEFEVGASAPLPAALGATRVVTTRVAKLTVEHDASCSKEIDAAQAEVAVDLAAGAAPWSELLDYTTFVDGKAWYASQSAPSVVHPGGSWKGRAKDLVYAQCNAGTDVTFRGVAAGRHTVTFKATIAGTTLTLESTPVEIDLACAPGPGDGDAGPDAAVGPDGSVEPRPGATPPSAGPSSGGCSASPAPEGPFGAAFLLGLVALGAAGLRARRRAR